MARHISNNLITEAKQCNQYKEQLRGRGRWLHPRMGRASTGSHKCRDQTEDT